MINKFRNFANKLGKWIWLVLFILAIIVWKFFFNNSKPVTYTSVKVSKGDLLQTLSTTGKIKADEYGTLTFQSFGKISWVNVKKGDRVRKGQAIAGLDTVILNAAYQQALNNYKNYQAAADSVLDSLKNHSGDETFAQKATRTAAEVARDNAYDALLAARQNLRYASIYAPFDGIVAEANPSFSGAYVTAASPASFVIVNPKTMFFESEIAETDLPKVKIGQKVSIKLDAYPDASIESEISDIGIVAFISSTGGNAYSLRINLPTAEVSDYKVGMEGDMDIILDVNKDVTKVPSTAIVNEDEKNYVWVYASGKINKREVQIGGSSIDETEIKSGLNDGETVITEPSNKFKDGQKVSI